MLKKNRPGSQIVTDEMIPFFGNNGMYKIPNKPTCKYKICGLTERGYLYTLVLSSHQLVIMNFFLYANLTRTGSMMMELIQRLPNPLNNPKEM